jgi:hypothetical protein
VNNQEMGDFDVIQMILQTVTLEKKKRKRSMISSAMFTLLSVGYFMMLSIPRLYSIKL